MKTIVLSGTMLGGATATLTSNGTHTGFIEKVIYDYADGASTSDLVLTAENNGISEAVLTKADIGVVDVVWYPRILGTRITDGASFSETVGIAEKIFVNASTFKAIVSEGALTASLKFVVVLSDE